MVGGDYVNFSALDALPERGFVGLLADGGRADELGALEVGLFIYLVGEAEVLGAGLDEDRLTGAAGGLYFAQALGCAEVDDPGGASGLPRKGEAAADS